ncbi:MAG: hypothetical protein R3C11_10085 [Planctomycetaceae bacterium]
MAFSDWYQDVGELLAQQQERAANPGRQLRGIVKLVIAVVAIIGWIIYRMKPKEERDAIDAAEAERLRARYEDRAAKQMDPKLAAILILGFIVVLYIALAFYFSKALWFM